MGPCTANAQRPTVDSRCRGTTISCCVADLRRCLPTTSVTVTVGEQNSFKFATLPENGILSARSARASGVNFAPAAFSPRT